MLFWDKIMLRKRFIIEYVNDTLKNTAKLIHSRHRSINNFLMNLVAALAAYCFYGKSLMTDLGLKGVNRMKKEKKIFVAGKVYAVTETNVNEIEKSVQESIDGRIGNDRVKFKLYTLGNVTAMFFIEALIILY